MTVMPRWSTIKTFVVMSWICGRMAWTPPDGELAPMLGEGCRSGLANPNVLCSDMPSGEAGEAMALDYSAET